MPAAERPGAGAPALPAAARGRTGAAREAFATYVVRVLNHAVRTLDPTVLEGVSSPACAECHAVAGYLSTVAGAGGRIRGGCWRVLDTVALRTGSAGQRQVHVAVAFTAQRVVESEGADPLRYPAGTTVFTLDIGRHRGGWRLLAIRGGSS